MRITQARLFPPQHNTEYVSRELPLLQSTPAQCPRTVTEDVLGGTGFPGSCHGNRAQAGVGRGGAAVGLGVREAHAPPPPGGTTLFLPSQVCPRRLWQIQQVDIKRGDSGTPCFFLCLERRPSFRGRCQWNQSSCSRQVLLSRQAPDSSLWASHCKPLGGPFLLLSLPVLIFSYKLLFSFQRRRIGEENPTAD